MLIVTVLCALITQAGAAVPINQTEENVVLAVALRDPLLRTFGPQYVVIERKTSISSLTPWLQEKPLPEFRYARDGTNEWTTAQTELLQSVKQRNKHSVSIAESALPSDAQWCRSSDRSRMRSCIIISRPGFTSDGTKAAVALLSPNLSGWTTYLEKREGTWCIVGRGFLFMAG